MNVDLFNPAPRVGLQLPAHGRQPLWRLGGLFFIAMLCFILRPLVAESAYLAWLLSIASCATCGLAWLLSRELFKPPALRPLWPPILVAGLFTLAATLITLQVWLPNLQPGSLTALLHMFITLISSTVLLLPLVEATEGVRGIADKQEQRFRLFFAAGYGLLLLASLTASIPAFAATQSEIKTTLAVLALFAAAGALHYRLRHPLPNIDQLKQRKKIHAPECNLVIAGKVKEQLEHHQIFLDAELKVAGLAEKIGELEYKVTQCITGDLQFRNFNHMVNTYRIAHAQKLLSDPAHADCSILTIAMDSGFNSVGPFNRAFKELVGKTPSEYRSEVKAQ